MVGRYAKGTRLVICYLCCSHHVGIIQKMKGVVWEIGMSFQADIDD